MNPILKWPGGKRRLVPDICELLPGEFRTYHEPFAGALAVFLGLHDRQRIDRPCLYDLNAELISTYKAVRQSPEAVLRAFEHHRRHHSEQHFYRIRGKSPRTLSPVATAGRMIYLNKACFNGLYRVNKAGEFNSPWGHRKSVSIDGRNLLAVSDALCHACLVQGDFASVLQHARSGDLVYLDPPYPDGFTAYTSVGFDESDHRRLRSVCEDLNRRNVMFIQSNADCEFVRTLYRHFQVTHVVARRNISCRADRRGDVQEVLITNY